MRTQMLAVVLFAMSFGATNIFAQDKDQEKERALKEKLAAQQEKERAKTIREYLDKRILKIVYDSEVAGTEIYNKGKYDECFRLYQGTIMSVQFLLKDYRAKLALSVKNQMEIAMKKSAYDGAFALRAALDDIIEDLTSTKSLWLRLGNTEGLTKIVDDVFLMAADDPRLNLFREKKLDRKAMDNLKQRVLEYISSVIGGPLTSRSDELKAALAGMKITDDEFTALASIVETVLRKNSVTEWDIEDVMDQLGKKRRDIVEVKGRD
jgi:hemoglobin